ncbi:MAG TPA: Asp-tRNA(Asn)/Glu-tRNA(Gln) amidotransferase subunit GatA [Candidatus Parcubacteria bacterium]|nr:Asp-tRNA(Asn)/Glu-tRNA(Gln) amidotransferase subunit GatA [Candidatus Parcubacteria bacterium]
MDFDKLTIEDIHKGLIKKEFSDTELVEFFIAKIERTDKRISAFLETTKEKALEKAKEIDNLISRNQRISVLAGVPFAVKDNILIEGIKTTCASKILADYVAPYSATSIKKLEEKGAVVLGKTNLDEFAMGSSTENSAFFVTKNPCDLERVPGGSSGGSAAAVAGGMSVFALGSDTGGSIRQPASFCGVVGLKPTYGAVSRYGLVAFASSLDQIGPLTKTTKDAKIVLEAISGRDADDSTSIGVRFKEFGLNPSSIKIGVPKEYFIEGLEGGVEKKVREAIRTLEKMGAEVKEISLPHTKYALASYYLIATAEASANLARYDGIKYGFSDRDGEELLDVYFNSRSNGFGQEVKRRIMIGTYVLSAGYYDAYYLKASKVRTLIKEDFNKVFKEVDVVITPTTSTTAFKIGEKKDPLSMYLSDIFTVSANLAGLPAVSVPVGSSNNLPVGLQIIGKPFEESTILEIGGWLEKNN